MVERQLGRNGGIDGGGGVSIISPSTYNVNESKRVHPNDVLPATSPGTGEKMYIQLKFLGKYYHTVIYFTY